MPDEPFILRAAEKAAAEKTISPDALPAIDLYLDQVLSILDEGIGRSGRAADEHPVTKAMIHNYTKGRIIGPVKGKKYPKEQVLQLLLVYYLKGTLSLQDIRALIESLSTSGQTEEGYRALLKSRCEAARLVPLLASQIAAKTGAGGRLPAILVCTAIADLMKRTAEALIDEEQTEQQAK